MANTNVKELERRLEELHQEVESLRENRKLRRRAVLGGLTGLGAAGMASQPAAAASSPWNDSDGDGKLETDSSYSGIDVDSATVEEFNNQRIYDTSGRYHAALDGSNDAQKLLDAINDRRSGTGIVIPDPGFDLDWEQQVEIPADEQGFTIHTVGTPKLVMNSSFSGTYALLKPGSTAGKDSLTGYKIGPMIFEDPGTNADWAIGMKDVKESIIYNPIVNDIRGVQLVSANETWSNQNLIFKPYARSNRGPLVHMKYNGESPDQNWVFAPHYNETADGDASTHEEVAFRDEGKDNTWLKTRVEMAKVAFEANGAYRYYVEEKDWDRSGDMDFTVREKDGGHGSPTGEIHLTGADRYRGIRLLSPATEVHHVGVDQKTAATSPGAVNVFDGIRKLTRNHELHSVGLGTTSNSTSSNIGIHQAASNRCLIRVETEATSGSVAAVSTGKKSFKPQNAYPKVGWGISQAGGSPKSQVEVNVGIWFDSNNRAELVYEPENSNRTNNWYFELYINGNQKMVQDMGVGPADNQAFTINRERAGPSNNKRDRWSASVDQGNTVSQKVDETMGRAGVRFRVKTLEDSRKQWRMSEADNGTMLYRLG